MGLSWPYPHICSQLLILTEVTHVFGGHLAIDQVRMASTRTLRFSPLGRQQASKGRGERERKRSYVRN